ncbi:hypothetical protein Y1Q_0004430 [Alligator mississippiensis]|uniref:Ig-like domain-containing protein n=1 Tax=Alligator mississippiensis TaxID=8496 RepID=A0A151NTA6_ALLMI|nr:hypothetical protein Y1Q_0004430 [Alligator mississippiensis]
MSCPWAGILLLALQVISDVREEDSGVYYCALNLYIIGSFRNRTRLIVSDAPQRSLAILAPSPLEDAELPDPVPLLCLLFLQTRAWRAAVWDLGEGSPGQMDSAALEGEGMGSLTMVPRERWDTGTHCTCTAREEGTGRNISTVVAKDLGTTLKGPCWVAHWVGLPCVCLLLLIQVLILLSTKCPHTAGRAAMPGSDVRPRQSPEDQADRLRPQGELGHDDTLHLHCQRGGNWEKHQHCRDQRPRHHIKGALLDCALGGAALRLPPPADPGSDPALHQVPPHSRNSGSTGERRAPKAEPGGQLSSNVVESLQ